MFCVCGCEASLLLAPTDCTDVTPQNIKGWEEVLGDKEMEGQGNPETKKLQNGLRGRKQREKE